MNIDEIRRNAPDGATHYRRYKRNIRYYLFDYSTWTCFIFVSDRHFMPTKGVKVKTIN